MRKPTNNDVEYMVSGTGWLCVRPREYCETWPVRDQQWLPVFKLTEQQLTELEACWPTNIR